MTIIECSKKDMTFLYSIWVPLYRMLSTIESFFLVWENISELVKKQYIMCI
jgi:hypothetical protein